MDETEHKIIIDEHMTATIKIPNELSALELKALMHKASKLFNLSATAISDKPRVYSQKLSPEEKKEMIKEYDKGAEARKKLCEKHNLGTHELSKKVYYYRARGFA